MSGQTFFRLRESLVEKTLTAAEKSKREEVAKAIKREHPGMDKSMKMAIATATAKRVAEDAVSDYMAKGGKVTTAPYKKPRKAEKTDYSSKHIGGKGEHKSGKAANTTSPKPVGEETEQIDELSKTTIASYIKKASSSSHPNSASNLASRAAHKLATSNDGDDGEKEDHKSFNRSKNISKAVDRLTREEIEDHSDPLSEEEYDRIRDMYGKGAARGMMNSRWNPHHPEFYGKKRSTSSPSSSSSSDKHYHKVPFAQKDDAKKEGMRWDSGAKKWYHTSASASKASKFQKEEVELVSELKKSTLGSYVKKASWDAAVKAAAGRTEPGKGHTTKSVNRLDGIAKATDRLTKEEIEQIDELKKSTLGSYVKKANKEVADNAWKAGTAGAPDLLQQGKLRAKAFFKAKRRMAGIDKATDRLTKEETEQIDELKKSTLASYTSKVVDPVYGMPRSTKKIKQRLAGLQRAHQRAIGKKPTSEEVEINEAKKVQMHKPGWMLRADPELAAKFKKIEDRKKAMNKNMAKYGGKTGEEIAKMSVKEQVTQVDEYSTEYLASYKKAAGASARAADQKGDYKKGNKRFKGILAATRKQFKNEAGKK